MNEDNVPPKGALCAACGLSVGPLWYELTFEEWYLHERQTKKHYLLCEDCRPKVTSVIWSRRLQEELCRGING